MRVTLTDIPTTSAVRFSPRRPLGTADPLGSEAPYGLGGGILGDASASVAPSAGQTAS